MAISESDLRDTYRLKTSDELVSLYTKDITEIASHVIELELSSRGVAIPDKRDPASVPQIQVESSGSYWRGRQPLLKTFVTLVIAIGIPVQLIGFFVAKGLNSLLSPPWGGVAMLVIVEPYVVFAVVSVLRSVGRSKSFAGAQVAKILVTFWALPWLAVPIFVLMEGLKARGIVDP